MTYGESGCGSMPPNITFSQGEKDRSEGLDDFEIVERMFNHSLFCQRTWIGSKIDLGTELKENWKKEREYYVWSIKAIVIEMPTQTAKTMTRQRIISYSEWITKYFPNSDSQFNMNNSEKIF